MANKTYTAQEMREAAECLETFDFANLKVDNNGVGEMLRQAANAEDELRTVKSTWLTPETSKALFNDCESKTKDLADLKARLEAVMKECKKMRDDFSKRMLSFTGMGASNMKNIYKDKIEVVDDILRLARGEPENENE